MVPKSIPKRGQNLRANKSPLGTDLGRFGVVLGGCPGGIFIDFLLVFVLFRGNRRFRCETGPKTVWGRNLAENDAKLRPQNDPKSVQNRYRKLIKFLIDFLGAQEARIKFSRGGGEITGFRGRRSWAVLWRSWSDILSSPIFDRFLDRFWSLKGR